MSRRAVAAVAAAVAAGCALTSQGPPLELRYFSPEGSPEAAAPPAPSAEPAVPVAELRLARVSPGALHDQRIVHRESAVELDAYESLRWAERPEIYVRRALAHALFETHPLAQVLGGRAPSLDVEIVGFEEVQRGGRRAGRVELRYQLSLDRAVLARGVAVAERPAASRDIDDVVAAIGAALRAAADELAGRVVACLATRATATAPSANRTSRSPRASRGGRRRSPAPRTPGRGCGGTPRPCTRRRPPASPDRRGGYRSARRCRTRGARRRRS